MKIEEERVAYTGFAEVYDQFMDGRNIWQDC